MASGSAAAAAEYKCRICDARRAADAFHPQRLCRGERICRSCAFDRYTRKQRANAFSLMARSLVARERRAGAKNLRGITATAARAIFAALNKSDLDPVSAALCRADVSMPFSWPGNATLVARASVQRQPPRRHRKRRRAK